MEKEFNDENFVEINLQDLFKIVVKRIIPIIIITVLVGVLAGVYSFFMLDDIYQASATVIISSQNTDNEIGTTNYSDYSLRLRLTDSYRTLAKTDRVLSQVIEKTDFGYSISQLKSMVSVESLGETEMISMSVQSSDPRKAQITVNALVDIFQEEVIDIMKMDNVQVIDYAKLPTYPVKPNRLRNIFIAMIAACFLSIAGFIALDLLDTSIKSSEQVEKVIGVPVLGSIPTINGGNRG